MVRPSGDHIGWRASLKTSVMRVIAPPAAGIGPDAALHVGGERRPSGEIATDIDVPSRTVTSIAAGAAGAAAPSRRRGLRLRALLCGETGSHQDESRSR